MLALLETLADFGTVQYYGVHTFTTAIYRTWYGLGNREGAAQISLVLIAIAVLLIVIERQSRGHARFHVVAALRHHAEPIALTTWRAAAAMLACTLPVLMGFFLPTLHLPQLAFTSGVTLGDPRFLGDAANSLALATIAAGGDGKRVLTHVEHNLSSDGAADLNPATFAQLVGLELGGQLTATQAKTVLAEMVNSGRAPDVIAAELGFEAMDSSELEGIVDGLIAESPEEWADFCTGDDKKRAKLQGFFTGKIMKATKGQADGKAVAALLESRRAESL